MLGEHWLLHQLLAVVLLDVAKLGLVRDLSVIDDWLHVILEFLHDVFVLQRCNIHIFPLNICIKEGALLCRMTILESFVPAKSLELKIEVKNKKRVCKIDVRIPSIISSLEVHREVKVVKSFRMPLLNHMK